MDRDEVARLHDEYMAARGRDDHEAAMAFWSDDIVHARTTRGHLRAEPPTT